MRRTIIALVAVLAVVGAACTSDGAEQSETTTTMSTEVRGPTGVRAFAASSLQPFDSCTEFLDYVKGLPDFKTTIDSTSRAGISISYKIAE